VFEAEKSRRPLMVELPVTLDCPARPIPMLPMPPPWPGPLFRMLVVLCLMSRVLLPPPREEDGVAQGSPERKCR
jgi:hypothetical protein